MRRLKLRKVLVIVAVIGTVSAGSYVLLKPVAPAMTETTRDIRVMALDSTTLAGLNLQSLTVEGREQTNRDELIAAIDIERGAPILAIDVTRARESIESLPWVKNAKVERRLPGGVHIILKEYEPYALWQRGDRYTLVNRDGIEIVDVPGTDQRLPLIVGPDAPLHASEFFETVTSTNANLANRIVAAVRVGGRRWNVYFDDYEHGINVRLPEDNLAISWTRLADIERSYQILERDLEFIDMRVEGQLIIRINNQDKEIISPAANEETKLPELSEQRET